MGNETVTNCLQLKLRAADGKMHEPASSGAGWNLGNTLDSNSGDLTHMWLEAWSDRSPKAYETAWGQPQAPRELIHMFKEAGFGAIRVPVTWYPRMGTITLHDGANWDPATWSGTAVDPAWMTRVKEVVDYVIDEGLSCILNVHHDTGASDTAWLVASEEGFAAAKDRYQALWEQIATEFRDYGEKCWTSTTPGATLPVKPMLQSTTKMRPDRPITA